MRPTAIDPQDADGCHPHPAGGNRCPRGWWSAPTAGNRCAARPPASTSSAATSHQSALTFNIGHSRPHKNISTEFHTPQGPCVFVPLPGNRCSVVWVIGAQGSRAADGARATTNCPTPPKSNRIPFSAASRSSRGAICFRWRSSSPGSSPAIASRWSAKPPMCCRRSARRASTWDCATPPISPTSRGEAMLLRRGSGRAAGAGALSIRRGAPMSPAGSSRSTSPTARCSAISLPMQSLRAAGLHLIGSFGPLRRLAMREGLAPSWRPRAARFTETPAGRSGSATSRWSA